MRQLRWLAAIPVLLAGILAGTTGPIDAAVQGVTPERVLDTRHAVGAPAGRLQPGQVLRVHLDGVSESDDTIVLLNLTAVRATSSGFVSAWSCSDDEPDTSVLNFRADATAANAVVLPHTTDGLCFSTSAPVDLLADLTGVVTAGDLVAGVPLRVADSRPGRIQAGREYRYTVAGNSVVPSGAAAAVLNVTVHRPSADGFLLVAPCDDSTASTMNFSADEVVAHLTFAAMAGDDVCVTSSVDTGLILDAFGAIPTGSELGVLSPDRLVDTRNAVGVPAGRVGDGDVLRFRVAGRAGVPNDAAGATVNVAAVQGSQRGYLSMWSCDGTGDDASILNLWPGVRRANQGTFQLSAGGDLCLRVNIEGSSTIHVIVDAVGYVDGDVDRPPPPSGDRFETLPVGATLPSGAECAARVRPAAEIRPENAAANATRGFSNGYRTGEWSGFARIDGDFVGTTDEIIQWAACKWGLDEDMARAQVVKESWWYQSANGDGGDSFGLGQVRVPYHGSRPAGSDPGSGAFEADNAIRSSAYNLDYTFASWRACFEGVYQWLNGKDAFSGTTYVAGDAWGCMGVWFSGRWYTQPAINYIEGGETNGYGDRGVKQHLAERTWEDPVFVNG